MSYAELEIKVIQWAEARRIIPNATPQAQLNKLLEELAELFKAQSQNNLAFVITFAVSHVWNFSSP